MLDRDEVRRWERLATAMGRKADDAEGLAQVARLAELFAEQSMVATDRLLREGYSYEYLAAAQGVTRQALQQRHARYLARHEQVPDSDVDDAAGSTSKDTHKAAPPFLAAGVPASLSDTDRAEVEKAVAYGLDHGYIQAKAS